MNKLRISPELKEFLKMRWGWLVILVLCLVVFAIGLYIGWR